MSTDLPSAMAELSDQVAIVTGGGRGLGQAFAQALAAAGAKVAITARTESQLSETIALIEGKGGTAIAFTADVTDRSTMEYVMAEVERQLGPVDILVNNAAVITPLGHDWEVDPDEWWRTLEINIRGPFLCTQIILPRMIARRKGRIVNISSGAAHGFDTSVYPYGIAYCTSKAALARMTSLLAASVQEHEIQVFALAPGGPTTMIEILATSPKLPAPVNALFQEALGDESGIAESAQMLMFLVSGQADYLTGRHISVTDSIDDLLRRKEKILQDDLYTIRLRV
jgi:NAD(P)-dependent dehydrogenase (short-subunit alcohol dehydrogenase family)